MLALPRQAANLRHARRFAAATLLLAMPGISAGAAAKLLRGDDSAHPQPAPTRPPPEIARLTALVADPASSRQAARAGAETLLTRVIDRRIWRFASARAGRRICWAILIPGEGAHSSCTPASLVAARGAVLGAAAVRSTRSPSWDTAIVYGFTSAAPGTAVIRSSHGGRRPVRTGRNGMFWAFWTKDDIQHGDVPTAFVAGEGPHRRVYAVRLDLAKPGRRPLVSRSH